MLDFVDTIDKEVNQVIKIHTALLELKQELRAHLERIGSTVDYRMLWDVVNRRNLFPVDISDSDYEVAEDLLITLYIMAHDTDGDMTQHGFSSFQQMVEDNMELV